MYYSQLNKLAFIDNGTTLLHSTQIQSISSKNKNWKNNVVVAWNLKTTQPRYICPGLLIGVSRNRSTFLTHHNIEFFNAEEEKLSAWEAATGIEIPLEAIKPDDYELHQRILISARDQSKLTLHVNDVLNRLSPTSFLVPDYSPAASGAFLDTWAMTPNNRYIIVTLSGDVAGHDWAKGVSISIAQSKTELIQGKETHSFQVNRFQGDPSLNFSEEHNLMAISGGNESFTVYDLNRWQKVREVWIEGFRYIVGFHPKNKWFIAATSQQYMREQAQNKTLFHIYLLDIKNPIRDGAIIQRGKVKRIIKETRPIEKLLFHPNGKYLVSLLTNNTVHLWDIAKGELAATLSLS
jgi:WD40 repeat protein